MAKRPSRSPPDAEARRSPRSGAEEKSSGRPPRRSAIGDAATNPAAAGQPWPPDPPAPEPPRREIRPHVYAGFDLAVAAACAVVLSQFQTRRGVDAALLWTGVGVLALAGAGMLWRSQRGWRLAVAGCGLLLLLAVVLLVLILLSASFLAGVYGALGQGAATVAVVAGALVVEFLGLLPAFQLKFLLTRAGRRHFARAGGAENARGQAV